MSQRGFTLLEMMLVILLMGMTAILVLIAFPSAPQKNLQQQQERFQAQLDFARDTSQQDGLLLGIKIWPDGWEFRFLQRQTAANHQVTGENDIWQGYVWQTWQPRRAALGSRLPTDLRLELQPQSGQRWSPEDDHVTEPDILLLPGGEITPFTLLFRLTHSEVFTGIQVDEHGATASFNSEGR